MKKYTRKQRRTIAFSRRISVLLFGIIMAAGFIVGLAFFARPATSAVEKRDLTPFPTFTLGRFLDGQYFSDLSTWYSDTYPGRETLMAAEKKVEGLYGVAQDEKVIGRGKTADAIPPTDGKSAEEIKKESVNKRNTRTEVPDANVMAEDIQNQIMAGLLVKDGAAYAAYYFDNDTAVHYSDVVSQAAERLEGKTNVYSILIPNNSGAELDDETLAKLGGSDQKQAIDYYYSLMSDKVKTVNTFDTLREHRDEKTFFGTDHHWTAQGAYYVYRNFCEAKGIEPMSLDEFEKVSYEPFYGSYYVELRDDTLKPDTVIGYIPKSTNDTNIYYNSDREKFPLSLDNQYYQGHVFDNVNNFDEYNQYLRFINGDQPLIEIDNPNIDDGSVCVLVKESYGNAFAPFLVDHYDKVYVVDFRKVDKNIIDFCNQVNATDLILLNSIGILNPGVADLYDYLLLQ